LGNLLEGSSTGDFERRMKGALGMQHHSLKRLRERALRGGGAPLLVSLEDTLKKASGIGISIGDLLQLKKT